MKNHRIHWSTDPPFRRPFGPASEGWCEPGDLHCNPAESQCSCREPEEREGPSCVSCAAFNSPVGGWFVGYTGYTTQYMEDDYNILQSTRGISIDQWIIWYYMDMNRVLNTAQVILFLGVARGLCIGLALHSLAISCDLLHLLGFGLLTCSWAWLPCSGQLSLQTLPCHVFGRGFPGHDMIWHDLPLRFMSWQIITCHCTTWLVKWHYMILYDTSLHIALHDIFHIFPLQHIWCFHLVKQTHDMRKFFLGETHKMMN